MKEPILPQSLSSPGAPVASDAARLTPKSNTITLSISGPGFCDSEEFEIADLRAARAGARKLMASAIRLFGKTEGPDSE